MGKALVVGLVLAWTALARADSNADVEKLVRAHVAASITTQGAFYDTLVDDEEVVEDAEGGSMPLFVECRMDRKKSNACSNSVPLFGNTWFGNLTYSAVKPIVRVDDAAHVATFYVTATLAGKLVTEGLHVDGKTQMRVVGIARQDKTGWKVAAVKYSASLPDAALLAHGEVLVGNIFEPKPGLEAEVASWFGHLADHQSAAAIAANGTGPAEVATTKPAMATLAKTWDKLTLKPLTFEVHEIGNLAYVGMTVKWTEKRSELTLDVAMILVNEHGHWAWTAINFGPIMMTEYAFR